MPLCLECYDYPGAVLWNANAIELWRRFTGYPPRALGHATGLSRRALQAALRVSYVKIAEYQTRGLVHFHAVIRLDGPNGSDDPPPTWADPEMLDQAVHAATASVEIEAPTRDSGSRALRWGQQVDVRPVVVCANTESVTEEQAATYIAKYATKGAEVAGTINRPIRVEADIDAYPIPEHTRRMIRTCWALGGQPEHPPCGCTRGRTCSASAGTSPASTAATPPPSANYAKPAPTTGRPKPANATAYPIRVSAHASRRARCVPDQVDEHGCSRSLTVAPILVVTLNKPWKLDRLQDLPS